MDMGSSSGTILGTMLNYKRDSHVHSEGFPFKKANIDRSSYRVYGSRVT